LQSARVHRAVEAGFPRLIGLRVLEAAKTRIVAEIDAREEHTTAAGSRVHGGFLMAFADTLGAMGTVMNMPDGAQTSTIESKTNFLSAAKTGTLRGEATPVHVGRTTQVWRTDVRDRAGKLIATVTQTQLVIASKDVGGERLVTQVAASEVPRLVSQDSVPDQRRAQIFQAASEAFGNKGYASTSVRDIADAAGMPVPTMYQYFRSKEDILSLMFETYMREIGNSISAASGAGKTATEKLKSAIAANLAMYDKYRRQIRVMYQETRSLNDANRSRALDLTRSTNRVWVDVIREGIASGEFRKIEPEIVANFIPMLCATWVLRRWNMDRTRLAQMQEALIDMVINGLAVPTAKPVRKKTQN
jgi:1,4-dihydroxy-2-naphthoyl-CoA hydrolase